METKRTSCLRWLLPVTVFLFMPVPAISQDHGSGHGGGGGGGCGDVFGDLIHILRDDVTGQPILAQRWVELPADAKGYGWGYCPVAVYTDESGDQQEIPFLPYSCDYDLLDQNGEILFAVEEVNYFGRLNGGRTKERNNRMHLDEVISNIKEATVVTQDAVGRLKFGFDCQNKSDCEEWATVDSPQESLALYLRVMKYGHLAIDPYEVDNWAHGDPKLGTQFHPALSWEDMEKFDSKTIENLMPDLGYLGKSKFEESKFKACWNYDYEPQEFDMENDTDGDGSWTPAEPFYDMDENGVQNGKEPFTDLDLDGEWDPAELFVDYNENGVADEFRFLCAEREPIAREDFLSASVYLAAAASKTGIVTRDLAQYVNRFLRITKSTDITKATLDTLPAQYRNCWSALEDPFVEGQEEPSDPNVDVVYDASCVVLDADINADCELGTPNHCLFPDLQERFMDFSALYGYERKGGNLDKKVDVIQLTSTGDEYSVDKVKLLDDFVEQVNGANYATDDIDGFVDSTNDILRAIEFIHNYEIPADLFEKYGIPYTNPEDNL